MQFKMDFKSEYFVTMWWSVGPAIFNSFLEFMLLNKVIPTNAQGGKTLGSISKDFK